MVHRRHVHVALAEQLVHRRRPKRSLLGLFGDPLPEFLELGARRRMAADREAVGGDDAIHGAGAGADDLVDAKPAILEQAVEHAPSEGTVGATSL